MKKISAFSYLILSLVPVSALADINTMYDAKEKARKMKEAVENSNVPEMIFATAGAVGAFVALIVVVFLLIMLLKR